MWEFPWVQNIIVREIHLLFGFSYFRYGLFYFIVFGVIFVYYFIPEDSQEETADEKMPGGNGTMLTNNPLGFCISSPFSSCDKTLTKSKLKVKMYLVTGSSREARERAQSKNMEAGIETETIEQHCLLCCSPLSLSLL